MTQFTWAVIFVAAVIIGAMWYEQAHYCSITEQDRAELAQLLESL
jgi:hypothetical protein